MEQPTKQEPKKYEKTGLEAKLKNFTDSLYGVATSFACSAGSFFYVFYAKDHHEYGPAIFAGICVVGGFIAGAYLFGYAEKSYKSLKDDYSKLIDEFNKKDKNVI